MVYKHLAPDYYEWQEFAIMMTPEAEILRTYPLCFWPHVHMVALPRQLIPICHYKHGI